MEDMIRNIAMQLVDRPEKVEVNVVEGNQTIIVELQVAKEDVGKIIGKQGRTADAMRTLLSAVGAKYRKRTVLEVIE